MIVPLACAWILLMSPFLILGKAAARKDGTMFLALRSLSE